MIAVPFILIIIGLLMVVSGIKGTQTQLGQQLVTDFTGQGNFFYWVLAIVLIGGLGYIDDLRGLSRMLLAVIIVSMLFSNRGFFAQFAQEFQQGSAQAPASSSSSSSSSGGGSSILGGSGGGSSILGGSGGGGDSSGESSLISDVAIGAALA